MKWYELKLNLKLKLKWHEMNVDGWMDGYMKWMNDMHEMNEYSNEWLKTSETKGRRRDTTSKHLLAPVLVYFFRPLYATGVSALPFMGICCNHPYLCLVSVRLFSYVFITTVDAPRVKDKDDSGCATGCVESMSSRSHLCRIRAQRLFDYLKSKRGPVNSRLSLWLQLEETEADVVVVGRSP